MPVRPETLADRSAVATLIARTYLAEGASTIEMTGALRSLPSFKKEFSFVNEGADKKVNIFGLYNPVSVSGKEGAVILAPLAVDTKAENVNVAEFLDETFKTVASTGVRYVFVIGRQEDLAGLGFEYADTQGFTLKDNLPISLLVKDLGAGTKLSGEVVLPEALL